MKAVRRRVKKSTPRQDTRPLRIIGGRWRGRKLPFPAVEGLRPTGDRIRETLFNWLGPYLPGARCLDLFAGSGALGLEALSRGAEAVILIERDPVAAEQLRNNLQTLDSTSGQVVEGDSLNWLDTEASGPFDIVFIDPPFQRQLWQAAVNRLDAGKLSPDAMVYLESEPDTPLEVPAHWRLHRDKTSGQVRYRLYCVD